MPCKRLAALLCLAGWALCGLAPFAARAEEEPSQAPDRLGRHLRESPRLLDDPGGFRQRLDLNGVTLQLFYTQYVSLKPTGGAVPTATWGHNGSYDFLTRVDVEQLAGWPGLVLLLHVKGQYDRNINRDVGALSDPIDDADFNSPIWVDQVWLQQAVLDDRLRLRLGYLDQQTNFDRNAFANSEDIQFSSTFLDNNPLIPLAIGLGAVVFFRPTDWLEIAGGFADGDNIPRRPGFDTAFDGFDSLNGYLELDLQVDLPGPRGPLPGSYRLGGFIDGRARPELPTGLPQRGHGGVYLSFDQMLHLERPDADEGLGVFGRFGWADPDASPIEWFWSLGGQYKGLPPGRSQDVLGLGVYQAIGSGAYRRAVDPRFDTETGIELYYAFRLRPWLVVTPDFQYVFDPGASGTYPDAVVVTFRMRVTF